jgi:hypothetical protein
LTFNKPLTFVPVAEGQALGTPEAGARPMAEARNYRGLDPDGLAATEADHFAIVRWALLDMRDLAQMLAHVHDVEIEIGRDQSRLRTGSSSLLQRPNVPDDAQDHQGNDNPSPEQRRSLFFHVRLSFGRNIRSPRALVRGRT